MLQIRYATNSDKRFWYTLDGYMRESEFELKVRDNRCYIISVDDQPIGILRYHLFWDNIPFLSLVCLQESYRGKGFGKKAMQQWEDEMRNLEYQLVMTSTQADEHAQFFYRKLGYQDSGCLVMNMPSFEQPLEMFFVKLLINN